ncbi:hypothetical protein, partial [Neisseria sp. P0013.S004]|uniref:hypothetical protein n=1 Tax=Neisseria sp. P0013.S004 TaxID=3436740 RepID=UPI003F80E7A6
APLDAPDSRLLGYVYTRQRYDFDSRPADTSARTPLKPTTLDRLERGSHAYSYRWNPKPKKPESPRQHTKPKEKGRLKIDFRRPFYYDETKESLRQMGSIRHKFIPAHAPIEEAWFSVCKMQITAVR